MKEASHKKKHKKSKKKHSHHSSKDKEQDIAMREVEERDEDGQLQGIDAESANERKVTISSTLEIGKPESYTSECGIKVHEKTVCPSGLLEEEIDVFDNGSALCSSENDKIQNKQESAECVEEEGGGNDE